MDPVLRQKRIGVAPLVLLETSVQGHATVTCTQNYEVIRLFYFVNVVQDGQSGQGAPDVTHLMLIGQFHDSLIHDD
jgi:hypothetical protein